MTGDDDTDEVVPLRLKETKRFKDRKVIGMEIGGQMLFLLAVHKEGGAAQPTAQAANGPAQVAANGSSDAPPEPVPMDATS